MDFIWQPNNDGHKDDSAPGEKFHTSFGVTDMTWNAAVTDGIVSGSLRTATKDQFLAIYRARYWNSLNCSSLPGGVDLMAFNDAVLCGPGHASRLIQRIVGAKQDGAIGPMTLRASGVFGVRALIDAIADGDIQYFMSLHNAPMFLKGWTRRTQECRTIAYRLAGLGVPPVVCEPPLVTDISADKLNALAQSGAAFPLKDKT